MREPALEGFGGICADVEANVGGLEVTVGSVELGRDEDVCEILEKDMDMWVLCCPVMSVHDFHV